MNAPAAPAPDDEITFVITSCGRFDLLAQTLASFLAHNTAPIATFILIEDSGDGGVRDVVAQLGVPFEIIVNDPPLGQMAAIDRAYARVATPYIFHCEDDWRFFRSGFVEESLAVLKSDPAVSTVLCRRPGQNRHHDLIYQCPLRTAGGVRYRRAEPWMHWRWLGYSFNPGLRRLSDYRALGAFARLGVETDASVYFKSRGMAVANLAQPACETTGSDRRLEAGRIGGPLVRRVRRHLGLLRFVLAQQLGRLRAAFGRGPQPPPDAAG